MTEETEENEEKKKSIDLNDVPSVDQLIELLRNVADLLEDTKNNGELKKKCDELEEENEELKRIIKDADDAVRDVVNQLDGASHDLGSIDLDY